MITIIKNGIVVTESGLLKSDICIENELITDIAENVIIPGAEIIDAEENYVIPGGVDVHTHLNLHTGTAVAQDNFYTGTLAAACGGTTTIVDHIGFGPTNCNLKHQVDVYHKYATDNAVIDYGFHGVLQHVNNDILDEIEELVAAGIPSFKAYLTYDFKLNDLDVLKVLLKLKKTGGLLTVHPENDYVLNYFRKNFMKEGKTSSRYHAMSRPDFCEAEAINRVICLAEMVGNIPLYIVHLSCKAGLDFVKLAQERKQNVIAETCPQYLLLDEEKYLESNNAGLKYVLTPPLRNKSNQPPLWEALKNGEISVVATDHCPFDWRLRKKLASNDFTKCPNGLPGIETRIPLMFSEGVMKKKISMERFVEVNCTNPAKIMGLYPQKGTISIGSDADIVIINPNKKLKLSNSILHQNVDYTPYEGMDIEGYPVLTMSRGKIIVKDNVFVGQKGNGRFIKRKVSK